MKRRRKPSKAKTEEQGMLPFDAAAPPPAPARKKAARRRTKPRRKIQAGLEPVEERKIEAVAGPMPAAGERSEARVAIPIHPADKPPAPIEEPAPVRESSPATMRAAEAAGVSSPSVSRGGFWKGLCHALRMQNTMPCVGLAVLAGCLTFVIAPDEGPTLESRVSAALDPSLPVIVIDAGHGGKDDGARSNGLVEKNLTLDVAFRVDRLLKTFGFRTQFTRDADTYLSLSERAAVANGIENSLFVSLHFNQSSNSAASGVETYYATEKVAPEAEWTWVGYFNESAPLADADTGEDLAGYVQAALLSRTEAANRGIKARRLYVVRNTRAPAVLVECGFLSNPFEARLIATAGYRDRLAAAIVEGVIHFQKGRPKIEPPAQLVKAER